MTAFQWDEFPTNFHIFQLQSHNFKGGLIQKNLIKFYCALLTKIS